MTPHPEEPDWKELWTLKIITTSVGSELRARYGMKETYSAEEVETACQSRRVTGSSQALALAMFGPPSEAQLALRAQGILEPVDEVRRTLASKLSPSVAPDCSGDPSATISFHDFGSSHFSSTSDGGGYGGDGGCNGSGCGGD